MDDQITSLAGRRVFLCSPDGPPVAAEADALDLIGGLWGGEADWVALPVQRLGPGFLRLRTGLAGAVIQKFVTYGLRLAIVGDLAAETARSPALADFVRESNRGDRVWFVEDVPALERRLGEA